MSDLYGRLRVCMRRGQVRGGSKDFGKQRSKPGADATDLVSRGEGEMDEDDYGGLAVCSRISDSRLAEDARRGRFLPHMTLMAARESVFASSATTAGQAV
jgi:hypothetical protein